jgi:CubicO group peptidase (beta-lactamase class C family)
MLANHTSGLPRLPVNLDASHTFDAQNPYAQYDEQKLFACLKAVTFTHKPGAAYAYSNLGTGLLGTVLCRRIGRSYEQLLADMIAKPIGLRNTGINLTSGKQMAQGYGNGEQAVSNWDFLAMVGAGGIRSSVDDLLRYVQANLGKAPAGLLTDLQLTHSPTYTDQNGHVTIGLGWHINARTGWRWHNGGTGGFRSFVGFDPVKKTGIVVLANAQADSPDEVASRLIKAAGL